MRRLLTLVFALALSCPALADGEIESILTPFDSGRLKNFDATVRDALAEARSGGSPEDVKLLNTILGGIPMPIAEGFDLTGDWRCRTIKAGGLLPLTVYPWFKCRVSDDGAGWMLEKLTGSQRTRGRFFVEAGSRLSYVGAGYVAGEKPREYGDDPKENQVAFVERRAKNLVVLMFPAPQYESKLDLLVLER
jgi:hypothetical protein